MRHCHYFGFINFSSDIGIWYFHIFLYIIWVFFTCTMFKVCVYLLIGNPRLPMFNTAQNFNIGYNGKWILFSQKLQSRLNTNKTVIEIKLFFTKSSILFCVDRKFKMANITEFYHISKLWEYEKQAFCHKLQTCRPCLRDI